MSTRNSSMNARADIITGAPHPHVRAREGDRYRDELHALARELGVEREVIFRKRFFIPQKMATLMGSADIYITPYCHEAQAVSETVSYAMGAGNAIISTPDWHATELLDDGRGVLVFFDNPDAIATAAIELLENDVARRTMRKRAHLYARKMASNQVAQSYMHSFSRLTHIASNLRTGSFPHWQSRRSPRTWFRMP
jgi:glycosyltransferase involved in cell wall biosynthesis